MNYFAKIILRNDFTKKDGTNPICLRLTINRRTKLISLQKSVFQNEWDAENDMIKRSAPHAESANLMLRAYLKRANDIIFRLFYPKQSLNVSRI